MRDQTCLPCEFVTYQFSDSRDICWKHRFFVHGDLDLWPWHSNSSEEGTKHVFPVNLAHICSVVPRYFIHKLECGLMPSMMAAHLPKMYKRLVTLSTYRRYTNNCIYLSIYIYCTSPRDGQTLCKVWLACGERRHCSSEAKTRNPLKFAGMPQTCQPISAVSGLKFVILWGHVEEILLYNNFFPVVDTCLSCEVIARQSCTVVCRWRFFESCISSELHAAHFRPAFYTVNQKKRGSLFLTITLANLNRFLFFISF